MKKKLLIYLFLIGVFGLLGSGIVVSWGEIAQTKWDITITKSLLVLTLFPLIFLTNIISWHLLSQFFVKKIKLSDNFRIWIYSNASRLIPGSFWQYPSRVYLFSKISGVSKEKGVVAVALEGIFNLGVGATIVALSSFFFTIPIGPNLKYLTLFFALTPLLFFILLKRNFLKRIAKFKPKLFDKISKIDTSQISFSQFLILFLMFSLQYILAGSALFLLSNFLVGISIQSLPIWIGIYTFSWLAGYLTFFSPSGLGVVEVSISSLLSLFMPLGLAISVAIVFRILLFLTEAVFLLVPFLIFRKSSSKIPF